MLFLFFVVCNLLLKKNTSILPLPVGFVYVGGGYMHRYWNATVPVWIPKDNFYELVLLPCVLQGTNSGCQAVGKPFIHCRILLAPNTSMLMAGLPSFY